jgi:hypothetical protein
MSTKPRFPRRFFENDLPKLLKLTDSEGNLPVISIVLPEGKRLDLKEFEVTEDGLLVRVSSEAYLISYQSILSLQVMPRSFKQQFSSRNWPHSFFPAKISPISSSS